jgi:hypothetical protein
MAPVSVAVTVAVQKFGQTGIEETLDFIGGPGRTRTCNQTVMSGESSPENPENIDE